jgi:hypothetical protein
MVNEDTLPVCLEKVTKPNVSKSALQLVVSVPDCESISIFTTKEFRP